jgi:GxxExxY protein
MSFLTTEGTQRKNTMEDNELTSKIIECAIKVHRNLGPGLLESAYKECLYFELVRNGLLVEKEKPLPLVYEDIKLDCGYRMDLLVEKRIVIEAKATDGLNDLHMAQMLTYLRLNKTRIGLLMNFNVVKMIDGIKRVVNGY